MTTTTSLWRCLNLWSIRMTRAEARRTLVRMLLKPFFLGGERAPAAAAHAYVLFPSDSQKPFSHNNVWRIRSGHCLELPFHTRSTQPEIVCVRRVRTYRKCSAWLRRGAVPRGVREKWWKCHQHPNVLAVNPITFYSIACYKCVCARELAG